MVRQMNRRIHSGSGFFGSFDAPWSERSWIDLSSKEMINRFRIPSDSRIQSWIFLKKSTLTLSLFVIITRIINSFQQCKGKKCTFLGNGFRVVNISVERSKDKVQALKDYQENGVTYQESHPWLPTKCTTLYIEPILYSVVSRYNWQADILGRTVLLTSSFREPPSRPHVTTPRSHMSTRPRSHMSQSPHCR